MSRWVSEVTHLCQDLGADCVPFGNALVARRGQIVLRLTEFQNHYLVAIGVVVHKKQHLPEDAWVGFATLPRAELPNFLLDTL
jgi:hypothetical protein